MSGIKISSIKSHTVALLAALLILYANSAMAQKPPDANATVEKPKHQFTVVKLTRYDIKQTHQKRFRKALIDYVAQALRNENNIMAEAYSEQEQPLVFWLIERWNSKDGYDDFSKKNASGIIHTLSKEALQKPAESFYVKDLEPISKTQWRKPASATDQPITIMLFVDAQPGTEQRFQVIYHAAMPQFRSEPGVINYQLSQLEGDNSRFVTYEKFRNEEAFQYHLKFPPIQPVIHYLNTSIKKPPFQKGLHRLVPISIQS